MNVSFNAHPIEATDEGRADSRNLIADYYGRLRLVMERFAAERGSGSGGTGFSPAFTLPDLDAQLRQFFEVATVGWVPLRRYCDCEVVLLDLMRNKGTNTTKTTASLLMVARAIEHIRRTGQPILIVTPTSGNKGVALRDSVSRAVRLGLVTAEQLRIITVLPANSRAKLRNDVLATNEQLRLLNPALVLSGRPASDVKELARSFVLEQGPELRRRFGVQTWFSLDLDNYRVADAGRAFIEHDMDPLEPSGAVRTIHAHAVSSAYGLLGYNVGLDILRDERRLGADVSPGFFLAQHLATPDMILDLLHGSFSRDHMPRYILNDLTGRYEQRVDPHFPLHTFHPDEEIDPTFYTRTPQTAPQMSALIRRFGGGGIVVSLSECLDRYAEVAARLEPAGTLLPADPRTILEWSLLIAAVGVLNAIDRKLIARGSKVVLHGSGFYTTSDVTPIDSRAVKQVTNGAEVARAVMAGFV